MSSIQPLLDAAGRRRSPATMPGARAGTPRATKADATRRTRQRSMRSSRSCARLAMTATVIAWGR